MYSTKLLKKRTKKTKYQNKDLIKIRFQQEAGKMKDGIYITGLNKGNPPSLVLLYLQKCVQIFRQKKKYKKKQKKTTKTQTYD